MAHVREAVVLLLSLFVLNIVKCEPDYHENYDEFYSNQINSLVDHLNRDDNRIYNYKYARLINAQKKDADTIDLTLDLEVTCRDPQICSTDRITCIGTVGYNEETQAFETQPGVACQVKFMPGPPKYGSNPEERHRIAPLQNEMSSTAAPAIKTNSYCLGCPEEVTSNAQGVDILANVALQHIESERENKYVVLKVLKIQRQIVAGVKYTLVLEVAPTFCPKTVEPEYVGNCAPDFNTPTEICEITYYQQPWLNRNKKNIVANNCTQTQQFTAEVNELDNEIDPYNSSPKNEEEIGGVMSPMRMRDLVSQIMFKKPVEEKPSTTESSLSESEVAAIEDFLDMMTDKCKQESTNEGNIMTKEPSEDNPSEEQKKSARSERSIDNFLTKVTTDEKIFVQNLANIAINELDNIDSDNHKRIVLQMLAAKKMYDNGFVYFLTMRVGVSNCPEESVKIIDMNKIYPKDKCQDDLLEHLTKICKIQVHVDVEKQNPSVLKSHCQDIKKNVSESTHKSERGNRTHRDKRGIPGGVNEVDPNSPEITEYVNSFMKNVAAERNQEFQQITVLSASKQVVAGMLYKFEIEVTTADGKTEICKYQVWDRSWLKPSKQIEEKCAEKPKKEYKVKRSANLLGTDGHDIHLGLFYKFINEHQKVYKDKGEFKRRFKIFQENMKKVEVLNKNEQGTAKYGPTKFADLTDDEFARYKGLRPELRDENDIPFPNAKIPDIDIPVEFDWRKKGVISPVKNQGACGSCWAFSVTGNIEGLYAIKNGKIIELSEQELVDCDSMDNGCGGGYMDNAYRAIEKLGGLETEQDYPYEAENEKCHFNRTLSRVQISGAVNISTDETEIAKWLVKNGPISIGINANAMQFYMGGISHPFKFLCDPKSIDHGVLLVGYGIHKYPLFNKTYPYWIVKNSWGETWGEQGYYRVYRGDGTCGVNTMPESAIL